MDLRLLFLVTADKIVLGRTQMHKRLADDCDIPREEILGGGAFQQKGTHFILYGTSHDFGKFDHQKVLNLIESEDVYWFIRKQPGFTFEFDLERKETPNDRF